MQASLCKTLNALPAGVVRLRPEDEDQVVDVCARSWSGENNSSEMSALWDWVLGPNMPQDSEDADSLRLELMQWAARFVFRELLRAGGFALGIRDNNGLAAVCIACPGQDYGWKTKAKDKIDAKFWGPVKAISQVGTPPCSKEPVRGSFGKGIEKRLFSLWSIRNLPSRSLLGEHLHIGCLATKPSPKGDQYKAVLLRAVGLIADELEMACYMELSNKDAVGYYRDFCFSEHGPFEVGPSNDIDETEPFKELFALIRPATRL